MISECLEPENILKDGESGEINLKCLIIRNRKYLIGIAVGIIVNYLYMRLKRK